MSSFLCCFKCLTGCGFRDCLLSMIAFRPPKEHRYEIKAETTDSKKPPLYKLVVPEPGGTKYQPKDPDGVESSYFWLQTKTNRSIPALFLENKKATTNYVLLYSHGNSTDLGRMRLSLQELSLTLNVHVFAYEYIGYGPAKGRPNDLEIIFGIIAAYQFLTDRMKIKWHQIILYGRSIGSGPSLYLASHPKYPVSGVILHSPIASGLRMLDIDMQTTHNKDLFPNIDFISHVSAHVFIMHGEEDKEVPPTHGKLLSSKCKNLYIPWWVPEGTHNDIDLKYRKPYFLKISKFVKYVKDFNLSKTEKELEDFYHVREWHHNFDHYYVTQAPKIEEKYQRLQRQQKGPDYGSFASNASFITNHNATNVTFKTNTESIITTLGDQTVRRNGQETARSATERGTDRTIERGTERESEEVKIEQPPRLSNLESTHKPRPSEVEFSYSYRSNTARTDMKSENRDLSPIQDNGDGDGDENMDAEDPLNMIHVEVEDKMPPNEMSFDQNSKGINEVRNVKTEPNYRTDEAP